MTSTVPQRVYLCGLLSDARIWSPVAEVLPGRVFAFPGFDALSDMAAQVLVETEGPLVLVGHSMGGRVALEAVRQAPERVAGLVLANTGVHPPAEGEAAGRQRMIEIARTHGMAALAEGWLPPMMGAAPERIAALMPALRAMVEAYPLDAYLGQIAALLGRADAGPVLAGYAGPVLLLSADHDRWSPPAQHAAMHALAPHATIRILPGAGHMLPVEAPEAVVGELRQWLEANALAG
ncbi:alpha/beta fold hydrolase [Sphingomonas sp. ABOLD]|uniref:alpha/beta fold hydrolase n=1 Tax=unclassified Sphingomonas TaxID=196159 RepID=UPI000F7F77EC|nr:MULTISPECIES: alpha/beta hydrolase [unclassified Sphingomonas]RSV37313.1 alpha/beta fold hydrolase [Sphingomonas sp. ABOLE]RSV45552.1 alpha/beta fold hydrolase [Sphingomonas sp. ABOLD]